MSHKMTNKQTTSTEKVQEDKMCMTYLKNVKTENFEIFKWQRAKLSQEEIDVMHKEIWLVYPEQWVWITKTQNKDCNCNK
jgi:hypothetical protein